MENRYLCIDVGGGTIKYAVLDANLMFYQKGSVPTPASGAEEYLTVLEGIFRKYESEVCGIAMSVPGIIDSAQGVCVTGGNLTYLENFPLVQCLTDRCHVPVAIMNDAKCAALAEVTWGSLADCMDAVVLVFGTGVGGAFIKDGNVHMGRHFAAGEFSFIMLEQECDLENSTWAERSGNKRLITMAARARGVQQEGISGYDVFRWAEEGDEKVLRVLDKFTRDIAFMIMNLQMIFDPERFAVGGGISRQPLLLQYIKKNLDYYYSIYPHTVPRAEVTVCKYYNDSNLIGALKHYLDTV